MNVAEAVTRRAVPWFLLLAVPFLLAAGIGAVVSRSAAAQQTGPRPAEPGAADQEAKINKGERAAEAALAADDGQGAASDENEAEGSATQDVERIRILKLAFQGGPLMWPILGMSLLVVTFGVERFLGLRRRKVLPPELIGGLGRLAEQKGGLDPRRAYRLCQRYPSAAANVIKTMLLKVGRPHAEVEHTVSEANNREAARLYANVRWLSLAAGVTPLLGLLGTVQGMIMAFFRTANLPIGANKADVLAEGIYVALVTTFSGLAVAIPAAVLAHFFEGWIQKLFRELDETLLGLMPQLERFEGRLRVSKDQMEIPASDSLPPAAGTAQQRPAAAPK